MATQNNKNVNQEKVNKVEEVEQTVETNEPVNNEDSAQMVMTNPASEKKGGFFRDMSIGMKIGVGLVFGGVMFGAGFLVKKMFFSGNDTEDDPVEVEGTVSEPIDG